MSKRVLIESRTGSLVLQESLSDESRNKGCLGTIKGPCADLKNPTRNNYFYSKRLWENVFRDPIVKESLEDRVLLGELDHPEDRLETKASNACIVMTDYEFTPDYLVGTFDILPTPSGKILKTLLDCGCHIGVSSRGEGDVVPSDSGDYECIDEDNYTFIAFDAVAVPAVKAAKPSLITESLCRTLKESIQKEIDSSSNAGELNIIKDIIKSSNLPDSDSLLESVNNKSKELLEGTTGSDSKILLDDLERSNDEIKRLNERIDQLNQDIITYKSRLNRQVSSRQKLVDESIGRRTELSELSDKYKSLIFESTSYSNEIESLKESLRGKKEESRKLRSDLRLTQSKIDSLEESLKSSQEDYRKLMKSSKDSEVKLNDLQDELVKAKENLKESNTKYRTNVRKYKDLLEAYAKTQCKLNNLNEDEVLKSQKLDSLRNVDSLIESLKDRKERQKSLNITKDRIIESLDKVSVEFNSNKKSVKSEDMIRSDNFMDEVNKLF